MTPIDNYIADLKFRFIDRQVETCYLMNEIGVNLEVIKEQLNQLFSMKTNNFEELRAQIEKKTGRRIAGIGAWFSLYKERNTTSHHNFDRHAYTSEKANLIATLHLTSLKELCEILGAEFQQMLIDADASSVPKRQHAGFKTFIFERLEILSNHLLLTFIEVALSMCAKQHPEKLKSIEKARAEDDRELIIKKLYSLLSQIQGLSSTSVERSQIITYAELLHKHFIAMGLVGKEQAIIPALKGWIDQTNQLYSFKVKEDHYDQIEHPNTIKLSLDIPDDGLFILTEVKALPEYRFKSINDKISSFLKENSAQVNQVITEDQLNDLFVALSALVLSESAVKHTKEWVILLHLPELSMLTDLSLKSFRGFVVAKKNKENRQPIGFEFHKLIAPELIAPELSETNFAVIKEGEEFEELDDLCDLYSYSQYKALSLTLELIKRLNPEDIFEDFLNDYPLIILTRGVELQTKHQMHTRIFSETKSCQIHDFLKKITRKYKKVPEFHILWSEDQLESRASSL